MTRAQAFYSARLEHVFDNCFGARYHTRLVGGAPEPSYQPASATQREHRLHYREDFFASALHETAHWCIAGAVRRTLADFGYWYAADGRGPEAQRAFEAVEDKPQALEWFFSRACGFRFRLSVDNLDLQHGSLPDTRRFAQRVLAQARRWQVAGLPPRAECFYRALCAEFGTVVMPGQLELSLADLD
ncbi:MAG: elongation factor P hydroxylase [Halioglobus sp.]|nr:elongation factor P hydroxylase [Halioglobus sp.]